MTEKEFIEKYKLTFKDAIEHVIFMSVLDDLYLHFTKEQVLEMIADFYDNADDIYNSHSEDGEKRLQELMNEVIDKL